MIIDENPTLASQQGVATCALPDDQRTESSCSSITLRRPSFDPLRRIGDSPRSLMSYSSSNSSISTLAMTVSDPHLDVETRAAARFTVPAVPRLIPSNYNELPSCYRWVPPPAFTQEELAYGKTHPVLLIRSHNIVQKYFPERYHGIRQAYRLFPGSIQNIAIRRGTIVIVEKVVSHSIEYRVNRARMFRGEVVDIEVVGLEVETGHIFTEASLSWAPISVEVPMQWNSLDLPEDTLQYLQKRGIFHRALPLGFTFSSRFLFGFGRITRYEERTESRRPQNRIFQSLIEFLTGAR